MFGRAYDMYEIGLSRFNLKFCTCDATPLQVCATLEDVYILVAPLDTWSMDDMERQRRARYQKSRGVMCHMSPPFFEQLHLFFFCFVFFTFCRCYCCEAGPEAQSG